MWPRGAQRGRRGLVRIAVAPQQLVYNVFVPLPGSRLSTQQQLERGDEATSRRRAHTSIAAAMRGVRPFRLPLPISAFALHSTATTSTDLPTPWEAQSDGSRESLEQQVRQADPNGSGIRRRSQRDGARTRRRSPTSLRCLQIPGRTC